MRNFEVEIPIQKKNQKLKKQAHFLGGWRSKKNIPMLNLNEFWIKSVKQSFLYDVWFDRDAEYDSVRTSFDY